LPARIPRHWGTAVAAWLANPASAQAFTLISG
jgi:hypothetical protein